MEILDGVRLVVLLKDKIEEAKKNDQNSVAKLQKLLDKVLKSSDVACV